MEEPRGADAELPPAAAAPPPPPPPPRSPHHLLQQRISDHVSFQRLNLTAVNLVLPLSFLAVVLLGIIFVLIILVLWWRNVSPTWKLKKKSDVLLTTMAFSDDSKSFRVEIVRDPPRIVRNDDSDLSEEDRPSVEYVRERERRPTVVTTRNYGGSSPKISEEDEEKTEAKFVFPPESDAASSRSSEASTSSDQTPKLKIPMPEQTWLTHKKPFECKTYRATIPRQLAEVVRNELGEDLALESRTKKFSATRSPSLEKDDKSPFVNSAMYDKNEVFAFEPDKIKQISSGNNSPIVEVRVQPQNELKFNVFDRNFNNNVTPVSPKLPQGRSHPEHVRTSSLDVENESKCNTNLRRFRSVNTKLNICSAADVSNIETQQERLEMQNSPRILECSSANEKSSGTKFNFSPKLLSDNLNSPKFFTPTDRFSPRFFAEGSPKSVYYDSVRSPKFFPDTPKSPVINDERSSLSPKAFTEHLNSRNNSPKLYGTYDQLSPRILLGKPRSPKVHSGNKENYFDFDSNETKNAEFARQTTLDEVDNASCVFKKPNYIQRYAGRKSIERERVTQTEKLDIRRYRRHNSCDTYNRNFENGNDYSKFRTVPNDNEKPKEVLDNMQVDDISEDVVDCCIQIEAIKMSPKTPDEKSESIQTLTPSHPHTAHERRQRLKSISLDSDNAKIIEQNLGLPIAKHMKQDNLNEALQDYSSSCCNVKRSGTCDPGGQSKFKFDNVEISNVESKDFYAEDPKYSPDIGSQKKSLRDSSDTKSFIDMPRFSPKEFEVTITVDEDQTADNTNQKRKGNKNLRNLTIDLTRRDSDLEKELLEFEKLYTDCEEKKVKTPTLKIKATSLDSSESINLSLPQKKTLEVPQNSVSVPNTPKRQLKRILAQKSMTKPHELHSGGKMGYNSLQCDQRRFNKWQPVFLDSGIFLKENHANLMLYQPGTSRANARRMGSFDESMADFAEHPPEINICNECESNTDSQTLGSNLGAFKQNLSVSSTNLKTLPEGVPSNDFEPTADEKVSKKVLYRRGSNQSLKISLDCGQPSYVGKYSTLSLQSSNCSINSVGLSCHNLSSIRNSASNFSLNTDNRQKKMLERRNSNQSLTLNADHLTPITRIIGSSNVNLQTSNTNLNEQQCQPVKNCLLQRRGSNNSLTLNIQNSNTNLTRFSSNSSLNINKDAKTGQRKGLLERRSSNTSLTLNINNSNPQLTTSRGLSISNYNLNGSTCNLSLNNSNQSINTEHKKGILERRSSNTSLTINIQNQEVPRDIEVDEKLLECNPQIMQQRDMHRKSLSTENLIPKSYKNRIHSMKNNENQCLSFGSHDNLWSNSYVESEAFQDNYGQNLTYVCGDPENEIIYAFGARPTFDESQAAVRNITTKPLSPQTTSEDFKAYLANIQHLQNASSVLTRKQLKDLNNVFQNGYSKVKCDGSDENGHRCSPRGDISKDNTQMSFPEPELPCSEYQKTLLRNLHKEFWDLPSNFQEKPMVFGSHPKNRYKTILPNEHSRFILKPEGGESGEGYVNANFIKGHEYTKNSYIATQGPLQNTIYDFWLMVHQNSSNFTTGTDKTDGSSSSSSRKSESPVQKIVMLTNFIENNRQKCEKYFPLENDEEITFEYPGIDPGIFTDTPKNTESVSNSFIIRNEGVIKKTGYTIRRLRVTYRKRHDEESDVVVSEETIVYHYWFHNWADHKCPKDVNALLNLSLDVLKIGPCDFDNETNENESTPTKFVFPPLSPLESCSKGVKSLEFDDESSPPTIVHCSAGIGRTGCLIAILNGIKQLSYDQKVDILGIVCNMRLNRGGMVQNSEQYELIHKVLCLYEQICLPNL